MAETGRAKPLRLDTALVRLGLAPSRDKARALIMAGEVKVDSQVQIKPDRKVSEDAKIEICLRYPYVSRGAFKLKRALEEFSVSVKDKKILDVGISTGGFTDLMLQQGAEKVVGVDVNIDQVDFRLKQNPKLKLIKKNARYLTSEDIGFVPDYVTMDLSFISVTKVVPVLNMCRESVILCMIKPQFEAPRRQVRRGGVIRSDAQRLAIVKDIRDRLRAEGWQVTGFCLAGVKGRRGNQEYFFRLEYGKAGGLGDKILEDAFKI